MTNKLIRQDVIDDIIKRINEGQVDDKLYDVAIQTAKRIFYSWCVDSSCQKDILGSCQSTIDRKDVVIRVSFILKIYRSLNTLFDNPEQAHSWMSKTNERFNNMTALQYIRKGDDNLSEVAYYLRSQASGVSY